MRVCFLQGVKWSDGSVHQDLPMVRLSELFNVNHFIVSQTNPHVLPFLIGEKAASDTKSGFISALVPRIITYLSKEIKDLVLNVSQSLYVWGFFVVVFLSR